MANVDKIREFDPIKIDLGGKERIIQFDMNAFALLENKFGSIQGALETFEAGRMSDIKLILWTGLVHEEVKGYDEDTGEPTGYNITPYQVGSWIKNPGMLKDVSAKLGEAMAAGMSDSDLEAAEEFIKQQQAAKNP